DLVALDGLQMVEVHDHVLDPERVLEPLQLGDALGEGQLAALEPGLDVVAGALALHTPAGGLAPAAADAAADAALGRLGTRGGVARGGAPAASPVAGAAGVSSARAGPAWPWSAWVVVGPAGGTLNAFFLASSMPFCRAGAASLAVQRAIEEAKKNVISVPLAG